MGKRKKVDKDVSKRKIKQESDAAYRKAKFFADFKAEAEFIRNEIVRDLPAYNLLLSMQVESFEEITLRVVAKQRGVQYDPRRPPMPDCPECSRYDMVGTKGSQGYYCRRCRRSFRVHYNSIISGKKLDSLLYIRVIMAILDGYGPTKTKQLTGVANNTYYYVRNRLFYALQLILNDVFLYGITEADCTFVRASYRGMTLSGDDFDENSMFYDEDAFLPREDRKRGGPYPMAERNANSICILSLIDEYGKTRNLMCGTGLASIKTFKMFVPEGIIKKTVPDHDSFTLLKEKERNPERGPGEETLLVTDKELALVNYADSIGIKCESHVYRKGNVQRTLAKGAHDIQRINSLHSRLKHHLTSTQCSSKYLPGWLLLFDFREMTGNSHEAITRVLEVLATPGLGKSPEFYQQMFSVPNYLEQWFAGDHPLKKLPYNDLLSFYLYDHIRNKDLYPGINITMQYIEDASNYSSRRIRNTYRNLLNAGYRDMILEYFGEVVKSKGDVQKPTQDIPPLIPMLYDEWGAYLRGEKGPRPSFKKYVREKNENDNVKFTPSQLHYWFKRIEELGICTPHPPQEEWVPAMPEVPQISITLYDEWTECLSGNNRTYSSLSHFHREKSEQYNHVPAYTSLIRHFEIIQTYKIRGPLPISHATKGAPSQRDYDIYNSYELILREQEQIGTDGMKPAEIREHLGAKYRLSPYTIYAAIRKVESFKKTQGTPSLISMEAFPEYEDDSPIARSRTKEGPMTLSEFSPIAAARWHPNKNGELTPGTVTYGSARQVWWLCPDCGYEYEAEIRRQVRKLHCPLCQKKSKSHFIGMLNTHEALMSQWHSTKNEALTPSQITLGSEIKAWWRCEKGHEWEAAVRDRAHGQGCPYCSNRRALPGFNDLASTHPEIAAQWHPTKNGALTAEDVVFGSTKKVWWLCENGHEWEVDIKNRTAHGTGCPFCAGRKLGARKNEDNFAATSPHLASQWHPSKNDTLSPKEVASYSNKNVWWLCEKGHEWKTVISNRARGQGCPYCSNKKVLPGFNDLASTHPEIAAQWHPTKNGLLTARDVVFGNRKMVWWLCENGHEWEAHPGYRVKHQQVCPECKKNKQKASE